MFCFTMFLTGFLITEKTGILCVPDPNIRLGSGGATIHALIALSNHFRVPLATLPSFKILLLHSGGDSQRVPICSR